MIEHVRFASSVAMHSIFLKLQQFLDEP